MIVVDANVMARLVLPGQETAPAEAVLKGDQVPVASHDVLELAMRSGCTAYDFEYVVVAREIDAPLVTSDRQVLAAFPEFAISPEDFVAW